MNKKFYFLEHTADVKFQAFGKTLDEAFKNSASALKEVIFKDKVKENKKIKIKVNGNDFESLLYIFLEEFLYLLEAENFIFNRIENIKIDEKKMKLEAVASGDKASNYGLINPVKAITYNEMFVKKEKENWVVQVVLDV